MRVSAAVTVLTVGFLLNFGATISAKEEADDDSGTRVSSSSNSAYDNQIEELASIMGPDELLPLCSNLVSIYEHLQKRSTFNPWGGKKRSMYHDLDKKNSFNPWGGKRGQPSSFLLSRTIKNEIPDNRKPVFNPWGGR